MKKLLFLAAMLIGATSYGQNNFVYVGATHDTLTNSNTMYAYTGNSLGKITGAVGSFGIEWLYQRVSGTAGGYAILQSSNGGTAWVNHYGTSADTFVITNTADLQGKHWGVGDINFVRYRVKIIGNQTQTGKISGTYSVRNN